MFGKLTLDAFKHEASQNVAVFMDAVDRHRHHRPSFPISNAGNGSGMNG